MPSASSTHCFLRRPLQEYFWPLGEGPGAGPPANLMMAVCCSMPHSSVPRLILKVPPSPHCSFHEFWVRAKRVCKKRAQKQKQRGGGSYLDEPVVGAVLSAVADERNGMAAEGGAGLVSVDAGLVGLEVGVCVAERGEISVSPSACLGQGHLQTVKATETVPPWARACMAPSTERTDMAWSPFFLSSA